MKKIISLIIAGILACSSMTATFAADFKDVPANTAVADAVDLLTALDIAKGVSDTQFDIEGEVNRQQMAAFVYRMMKAGKTVEGGDNTTAFTDLVDPYYNFMISWASASGIIKGKTETMFDPTGKITLQDAYTMMVRALGYDDGSLAYPIGYISLAEDLGLDENLPANLNYTDYLTRGETAIILANMFYAETAKVETKYEATWKEVVLSNGEIDVVSTGQVPVNYHKTVAEDVFGVEKVVQRVVATPAYSFNGEEKPDKDVEMIVLKGKDYVIDYEDDYTINDLGEIEFAELGLPGKADSYFLNDIEMYVRKNDGEYEIFGAVAKGKIDTVKYEDITFGTVSGTTSEKYYDGEEKEYKKINGLMNIDGVKTYIFNAPYSYTKSNDAAKYEVKFITLGEFDGDVEEDEIYYNYYLEDINADENIVWTDGYLSQIYFGGLGEIDAYDCDNDGRYDYIFNKPYSVMEIDTTEDEDIRDNDEDDYTLYTDMTLIEATANIKYVDEDYVIGYMNPVANYAKIVSILKPVEAEVKTSATKYFTLDSGDKVYYKNLADAVINGVEQVDVSFETTKTYYFYNGKLVKVDGVDAAINLDEKWIIITEAEPHVATVMVDGKLQRDYYIDVISEGEFISLKVADGDYSEYVNKLSTIDKKDKKGRYTFELLEAMDGDLTSKDESAEVRVIGTTAEFYHKSGKFYVLGDEKVYIKPYTQIIIKSLDKDGEEVVDVYDYDNLPDIKEHTEFTDVSYVLVNNVNSKTYENLAVFYGVYNGVIKPAKKTTSDIRIVKDFTTVHTEDETKYIYTLYNPATGEIEEDVEGYDETSKANIGEIVQVTAAGYVDVVIGDIDVVGEIYFDDDSAIGYVEIEEYDNNILMIKGYEDMFYTTKNTVITLLDISDETITTKTTSILDPSVRTYMYYGKDVKDETNSIRVIMSVEENNDDEYEVTYITVIRK